MGLKGPAEFKGKLNGLYINVDSTAEFEAILVHLEKLLRKSGEFYKGSKIIGLTGRHFSYREKSTLEELIQNQFGMEVESLEDLVLETKPQPETPRAPEPVEEKTIEVISEVKQDSNTHFVFGTLRSGKSVHHSGHVVIVGDVNPGAEIVAEGNIIVMGRVLGFVHAGSAGDDSAVVVANLLKPTQIRIAKYISVPPSDDHSEHTINPEKASVSNGIIKIEKCH